MNQEWDVLPDGEYGIVELFGHTTLVGRVTEVERFGTKMMALEPLYGGKMLPPLYHGGAAIYRLTPCSKEVAWKQHPQAVWQIPPALKVILPPELLVSPENSSQPVVIDDDPDEPF